MVKSKRTKKKFSTLCLLQKTRISILTPDKEDSKDRKVVKEREAGGGNWRDGSDVRITSMQSWGWEFGSQPPHREVTVLILT